MWTITIKLLLLNRVTRCDNEKITQNVDQPVFCQI
jgi:hypothetical protein